MVSNNVYVSRYINISNLINLVVFFAPWVLLNNLHRGRDNA